MKARNLITALLVASFLGFGFARAVSAEATCPQIDTETDKEVRQCSSAYVVDAAVPLGGYLWVTPVKADTSLPNLPNVDFLGPVFTLTVVDMNGVAQSYAHMEVCLADSSSSGNVYMWSGSGSLYSAKLTGSWWPLPTFHLPGWDCAATVWPGTYGRN